MFMHHCHWYCLLHQKLGLLRLLEIVLCRPQNSNLNYFFSFRIIFCPIFLTEWCYKGIRGGEESVDYVQICCSSCGHGFTKLFEMLMSFFLCFFRYLSNLKYRFGNNSWAINDFVNSCQHRETNSLALLVAFFFIFIFVYFKLTWSRFNYNSISMNLDFCQCWLFFVLI